MIGWALVTVALAAEPAPPQLNASWRTIGAADLAHESAYEDVFESVSQIRMSMKWRLPGGDRVVIGVVGEHNAQVGQDTQAQWLAWADDVYVDHPLPSTRLRVGNQVVRWGKLETSPLLDVLNPADLRHGALTTVEERRLPIPMVRARRSFSRALEIDAVFIPFFVPSRQHSIGSDWALFTPGLIEQTLDDAKTWEGDALTESFNQAVVTGLNDAFQTADDAFLRGLDGSLGQAGSPNALGSGAEGGLRLVLTRSGFDAALSAGTVHEDQTFVVMDATLVSALSTQSFPTTEELGAIIEGLGDAIDFEHPRFSFVGLDGSTTVGPLTVRAEAAAFNGRALLTRDFSLLTSREYGAGLGLDWFSNPVIQASIEGTWRHLVDADPAQLIGRTLDEYVVSTQVTGSLFRNQINPRLVVQVDPVRLEWVGLAQVDWRAGDNLTIGAGLFLFESPFETPTSLNELLSFEGGPIGLFDRNDAATATVTYWF
jgi:hypothetical protein